MKSHCLLDSGSKGMLISPKFMQAIGIKTFALETPIVLQLACRGSHSTINYRMNAKIKFGHTQHDKYFDVANVKYYDTILGTPFLRKHNTVLGFSSPGNICMGNEQVLTNKKTFDNKALKGEL